MKSLFFAFCLIITSSFVIFAHADDTSTINVHSLSDPFFESPIMPSGVFKGQTLSTVIKRSVVDLTNTNFESHYGKKDGSILVGNLFHNGKFYIGRIQLAGLKTTYFMREQFAPLAHHTMVRFEMADSSPVELIAEIPTIEQLRVGSFGTSLNKPILLSDLFLSIEGTPPKGIEKFIMTKHGLGQAAISYRITSAPVIIQESVKDVNHPVQQFVLDITDIEAQNTLLEAIRMSHLNKMDKMYNIFCSNCTNLAFDILETAIRREIRSHSLLSRLIAFGQAIADKALFIGRYLPALSRLGIYVKGWSKTWKLQAPNFENDPIIDEWMTDKELLSIQKRFQDAVCDDAMGF